MSTVTTEFQHPGVSDGAGVLESCLIDCSRDTFADEHWGRKALLTRGASDFSDLFSAGAVDELISRRGLRSPFLRVAKDGATLPTSSFTSPAGVGATIGDQLDDTRLWRQFHAGATLVLQALQRTWEPIGDFTAALSRELGNPVQANAYVTPPQNQGFDDHYDVHDVFVLQIHGTKRWVIHEPVFDAPLRDQPWTDRREAVGEAAKTEPAIDAVLEPGDALYLPRGWLHAATAQGDISIHLTFGIHNWTRFAVAEQLAQSALDALHDDPAMRASLALGESVPDEQVLEHIKQAMSAAVSEADPTAGLKRQRRSQARPAPLGPLAQHAALAEMNARTPLELRAGLDPTLEGSRLHTRIGWFDFSAEELVHVRSLLEGAVLSSSVLGTALAQRLLGAGAIVPADS